MKICNNKNGFLDCYGGCYKDGLCVSKCKCKDALIVSETVAKKFMSQKKRRLKQYGNTQI